MKFYLFYIYNSLTVVNSGDALGGSGDALGTDERTEMIANFQEHFEHKKKVYVASAK